MTIENLVGLDAIIHLAGLSNDPLGEFNPEHTIDINAAGTLRLATLAKDAGVSRFVFASSQSIYGISDVSKEMDEDNSEKNPITAYAIAKWQAEQELMALADNDFTCVFFRPSTVFGASPRLRCDIVFNNMVACAYTTGRIEILSDGSPWRPIVHVRDVANAFIAGIDVYRIWSIAVHITWVFQTAISQFEISLRRPSAPCPAVTLCLPVNTEMMLAPIESTLTASRLNLMTNISLNGPLIGAAGH